MARTKTMGDSHALIVKVEIPLYNKVKETAKKYFGNNISELVRKALIDLTNK